jgi:hypothetical protein
MMCSTVVADEGKVYGISLLDHECWTGTGYVAGRGTPSALNVGTIQREVASSYRPCVGNLRRDKCNKENTQNRRKEPFILQPYHTLQLSNNVGLLCKIVFTTLQKDQSLVYANKFFPVVRARSKRFAHSFSVATNDRSYLMKSAKTSWPLKRLGAVKAFSSEDRGLRWQSWRLLKQSMIPRATRTSE